MISNEGITTVGLLGAVFPASPRGVLVSSFGRPVCSVAEWVPHSVVFASGVDSVCVPLDNEGVGLGPSSSGPFASRPPLGIGLLRRPRGDAFHLGVFHALVFHAWGGGLLAALPEVRLPGMGCWCPFRVPQILCLTPLPRVRSWLLVPGIAVWALLLATSLPLGMAISLAPGRCLSVSTFYGLCLSLRFLF